MIYSNDEREAVFAMERARCGDYGEYTGSGFYREIPVCPVCGARDQEVFYINDNDECVGCRCCVYTSELPY